MNLLPATLVLGVVALVFYVAERSLSLFAWSRLEELPIPRPRRLAVERCLEHRELVITCFQVLGGLAVAALSMLLVWRPQAKEMWPLLAQIVLVDVAIVWVLPELVAWMLRVRVVLYLVPTLYRVSGIPFRAVRAILGQSPLSVNGGKANGGEEPKSEASAPDAGAREFFKLAVRLQHTPVREIMTPRTEMVSIADTATLQQAAELSRKSGYSRLPMYHGNRDQIIGVIHVKDMLPSAWSEKGTQRKLAELALPPYFVPETKTISELMQEFQRSNTHMGIVLDEYGGTSGLVTLEDVLEELVGEIHDEHERAQKELPLFQWLDDHSVTVEAIMHIEEFNEEFNFDLPEEEDFDTLGGFVMFILGKIAVKGESFQYNEARFSVLEADPRHVVRVRVDFQHAPQAKEKV